MKSDGEIMEILAAYDLTGSLRATAELTGCSHHTVAKHVEARDAGRPIGEPAARGRVIDAFLPKIEEWVEASKGRIRADKPTRSSSPWATRVRNAPPAARSRRSKQRGGWATPASTGPGSPSRGCGCSTTSATGPGSAG